ncbi:hypothetical protein L1887_15887 [Cichorium endivia]|nr:hypothetical protein L1887_15887 [Cichorium endivia]
MELEDEKRAFQVERDRLLSEVENLSASTDAQSQKMQDLHSQKLRSLESQIQDLKKKQENQAQKVQLQHNIKQRSSKVSTLESIL